MQMDINEAVASLYKTILNINQQATKTVGIDVLWMRSAPYRNSEDVIISEYTLLNVECPKELRVIATKADYNPGAYKVELFGISYEMPFEISIDLNTWQSVYGKDTMPQKDDIVYVKILNKLFEVKSSTINYGLSEMPTAFTVSLTKYNPTASRRENDLLKDSISDLTVAKEELFGEAISNDVADITDPFDFEKTISTQLDPLKEFDMDSVILQDVIINNSLVTDTMYDFRKSKKALRYKIPKYVYRRNSLQNILYFSCWYNIDKKIEDCIDTTISSLSFNNKHIDGILLNMITSTHLEEGQIIQMYRGSLLNIEARVFKTSEEDPHSYLILINQKDYLKANKILNDWYKSKGWRMKVMNSGYYEIINANDLFSIYIKELKLYIKVNNIERKIELPNTFKFHEWNYIGVEFTPKEVKIFLKQTYTYRAKQKTKDFEVICEKIKLADNSIMKDVFISNIDKSINMFNIRLYELENELNNEQVSLDAMSNYISNTSKIIFTDKPIAANKMKYIGKIS